MPHRGPSRADRTEGTSAASLPTFLALWTLLCSDTEAALRPGDPFLDPCMDKGSPQGSASLDGIQTLVLQPLGQSHRVGQSPILESSRSSRRGWVQGWRKAVPGGPREATR